MIKSLFVLALVAFVAADVSHLFRGNNHYRPFSPFGNQYKRPIIPIQYQKFTPEIPILKSDSNINSDGSYEYAYETANGIAAQEQGQQRQPEGGTVAQGSYQYISPEGFPVAVRYLADENGFQPLSDILPTSPPVSSIACHLKISSVER